MIAGGSPTRRYTEGVGEAANFYTVSSIWQLNSSLILVADKPHHCLRTIDRWTNRTQLFAGNCTVRGGITELCSAEECKFDHPTDARQKSSDSNEPLYITDTSNNAIRIMDLVNNTVTVFMNNVERPRYMAIDEDHLLMYVTTTAGLLRVPLDDGESRSIVIESAHPNDFFGVALIDESAVVVAALQSNLVLSIQLREDDSIVTNVCEKEPKMKVEFKAQRCSVYIPYSVTVLNETILVGNLKAIKEIPYSGRRYVN